MGYFLYESDNISSSNIMSAINLLDPPLIRRKDQTAKEQFQV